MVYGSFLDEISPGGRLKNIIKSGKATYFHFILRFSVRQGKNKQKFEIIIFV